MKKFLKKTTILAFLAIFQISCENEQLESESQTPTSEVNAKVGPWTGVFRDDFNSNGNLDQWQKTSRKDYNSSICNYVSSNPILASLDNRQCLQLSAYKDGSEYKSGHVKSNFDFHPGKNEEYRLLAAIKLIAKSGSTYKGFAETYGAWPAFWTVQESNWPTNGEIDVLEAYSFAPGSSKFASNLFYGTEIGKNLLGNSGERAYSVNEGWHSYEMRWINKNGTVSVDIYVDNYDTKRASYTNSVVGNGLKLQNFKDHNVVLNLNVGSNSNFNIFDNSKINLFSRTYMYIDYVVVEKRTL